MSKHDRTGPRKDPSDAYKAERRQVDEAIAATARELVRLVCAHVDHKGIQSSLLPRGAPYSDLIHHIRIGRSFVSAAFVDEPDELAALVEWRQR